MSFQKLNFGNRTPAPATQAAAAPATNGRAAATAPSAYINVYSRDEDGNRVRLGDTGIPLRLDKRSEAAVLSLLQAGTVDDSNIAYILEFEIGVPYDNSVPCVIDTSRIPKP